MNTQLVTEEEFRDRKHKRYGHCEFEIDPYEFDLHGYISLCL